MARFLTEHSSYLSRRQIATFQPSGLGPGSTTARSLYAESHLSDVETGSEANDLSDLLYDQRVTSEGLVNNAIDWLLEWSFHRKYVNNRNYATLISLNISLEIVGQLKRFRTFERWTNISMFN